MIMDLIAGLTAKEIMAPFKEIFIEVPPKAYEEIRKQIFKECADLEGQSYAMPESYENLKTLSVVTNGITVNVTAKK